MSLSKTSNRHKKNTVMPISAYNIDNEHQGKIKTYRSSCFPELKYHLYTPSYGGEGLPVLVAVHGISHRAKEQARAFADYAERYGFVVLAPLFCRKKCPAFQRLGVSQQAVAIYSDIGLNSVLDELGEKMGALTDKIYLFGFSAGGQFVHRYAMLYPHKVHAVTIGAAGWYTFPDIKEKFPRGLRQKSAQRQLSFDPEQFLKIPMAVFVGEQDNQSDSAFKRSAALDLQQGVTRIERAERWIEAMNTAKKQYGFDTRYEKHTMASCGHSFVDCVNSGQLAFKAINFLFERVRHQRLSCSALALSNHSENYRVV